MKTKFDFTDYVKEEDRLGGSDNVHLMAGFASLVMVVAIVILVVEHLIL